MELFLRIDDYTDATPEMCRILEWLLCSAYRIHIAVIPGLLTRTGARFLETIVANYPDQVEIGQHGYIHACRHLGRKRFEVGPGMSMCEQSSIIALGKEALRERLRIPTAPVFTPPFNGYDGNTILALIDNGFEILSAEVRPYEQEVLPAPLRQISINIDICDEYYPKPTLRSVDRIAPIVHRALRRDGYIGLMLHPSLTPLSNVWLQDLFSMVCSIEGLHCVRLSQIRVPASSQ